MKHELKEYFKPLKTQEEFYSTWEEETIQNMKGLKEDGVPVLDRVYNDYCVRWHVFKRDNRKCQVEGCPFPDSPITMHHFKHQANEGKTTVRNCVTVCRAHQNKYHKGSHPLTFADNPDLPKHIRGHTQALDKLVNTIIDIEEYERVSKQLIAESRKIRKANKQHHGKVLNWAEIALLMYWLFKGYRYNPIENA